MLPLNDTDRIEHFDAIFIDWMGGQVVVDMLIAHHRGMSYREIAQQHDVPTMTAHSWITRAKTKLRRVGLNADWSDPTPHPHGAMGPSGAGRG